MTNQAGIRSVVVHDVCISYSNAALTITDDDFDRFIGAFSHAKVRALLCTFEGRAQITPAQWRRAVMAAMHLGKAGVLVSDDQAIRAMGTAAGWAGANARGFDWPQFDAALEFLTIPRAYWPACASAVQSLRRAAPELHTMTGLSL
jgi:hypothetical protein